MRAQATLAEDQHVAAFFELSERDQRELLLRCAFSDSVSIRWLIERFTSIGATAPTNKVPELN